MGTTNFTCDVLNDGEMQLTEKASGRVFHFRIVNGELDRSSDRVEPSSDPDARPADFYREAALVAAKQYLDRHSEPQPTGWPLSHPEPRDGY
jgi:hypothetical protein